MDNREKNAKSDPILNFALGITIILIIAILILYNFFASPDASTSTDNTASTQNILSTSTTLPTTDNETPTLDEIETATPIEGTSIKVGITPTPFPSPIRGTTGSNLPSDFQVGPWRDNYVKCENKTEVEIQGVKIINGISPYQFLFWQDNKKWEPIVNLSTSSETYIQFKEAIIVSKGEYIHVEITFTSVNNQQVIWIDDLYYPYPDFYTDCEN